MPPRLALVCLFVCLANGLWSQGRDISAATPRSVALTPPRLWPGGILYYTVDPAIPNAQRIVDAIHMWTSVTPLQILPRATEANYVQFVRVSGTGAVCESALGMVGGAQEIQVLDGCTAGMIAHELGHAFGLQHEQARNDRNAFVTVLYENVDKSRYLNFEQATFRNEDIGYYDYDSIMHYGPKVFGVDNADTIETVPVGIPIGQRTALSAGDIDGVSRLYGFIPTLTTITTAPAGLSVTVDGVAVQTPHAFSWAPGSTHTLAAAAQQGATARYVFARWSDNGDAAHTITASTDVTVFCAAFQELHQLSATVASGGGSVSAEPVSPDGFYPERLPVRVTAMPASGSRFLAWSGATDLASNGEGLSTTAPLTEVLNARTEFQASFTTGAITTVDSQPRGRRIVVDGTSYLTPVGFSWTAGSAHSLTASAQSSTTQSTLYSLAEWEDHSTNETRAITAGAGDAAYTATFSARYLLTLDVAGSGTVTASPSSSDGFYAAGTVVQVTAQAAAGSSLRYWLGDPQGASPTISLTMDQPHTATAFFNTTGGFLVTSAASYLANPQFNITGAAVAPGELASIFGSGIGPSSPVYGQVDDSEKVGTIAGGAQVTFDGVAAPVTYASANQINVVVPAGVTPGVNTVVRVLKNGSAAGGLAVGVSATAPALFTADASGRGAAAVLNQDGSINSSANPAVHGSVITLYATGAGQWSAPMPDGQITGSTLVAPVAPVMVRVGKLPAKVLYAGTAPGLVSAALQVNVQLPDELLPGVVPVQLIVGQLASPPGVTVAVQ